jgi:hypothetical protein
MSYHKSEKTGKSNPPNFSESQDHIGSPLSKPQPHISKAQMEIKAREKKRGNLGFLPGSLETEC